MSSLFINTGYKLLSIPICYDAFQTAVGSVKFRKEFVSSNLSKYPMRNVLDLGCGTASTISQVSLNQRYVGVDNSESYLKKAATRATSREAIFLNSDIGESKWTEGLFLEGETLTLALGVYHHLDENCFQSGLSNVSKVISPGSVIVSLDPVIDRHSSKLATWFAEKDRGRYLRAPSHYQKVFEANGFEFGYEIKRNEFRIPYDLILIVATKQG